jgi:2-aminomuconate deaminase
MSPNGTAYVASPHAPEPLFHYPQARFAPEIPHRVLYVSGIACNKPDGTWPGVRDNENGILNLDIREQTAAALDNIDAIIKSATGGKGSIKNLIEATVYVVDMGRDYIGMNEAWNEVFHTRAVAPARATIGVKQLPDPRMIVEIKASAVIGL